MKRYWLPPVLAMGISLGIYSCNKSTPESSDPTPQSVPANEEADEENRVSIEDFKKNFDGYVQVLESGDLSMVVRPTKDTAYCVLQVVKSSSQVNSKRQICTNLQGYYLADCITNHLIFHENEPVTITNCGDKNSRTYCAYVP